MIDADKIMKPEESAEAFMRIVDTIKHLRAESQTSLAEWGHRLEVHLHEIMGDAGLEAAHQIASLFNIVNDATSNTADATRRVADTNEDGLKMMREREERVIAENKVRDEREARYEARQVNHEVSWKAFLDKRLPETTSHMEAGVILRGPNDAGFGVLRRDDSGLLHLTIAVMDKRTSQQMIQHRFFDVYDVQTIGLLEKVDAAPRIIGG